MGLIEIENLWKSFDGLPILRGVNLSVEEGTTTVILGRSGAGKSVLIKCVIGLVAPDAGSSRVDGQEVSQMEPARLNTLRKRMGFVFQNSALYDSMSVHDNLAFPLQQTTSLPEDEIERRVVDELERVGLKKVLHRMPAELSGGMRKRIGLARALITRPECMLYDEPTTGLDPITSGEISSLIQEIKEQFHTTSIAVTHDLDCARTIADKVAVLNDGVIRFEGSLEAMEQASDPLVKTFFVYR